jgi:hypothetical protein
VVAAERDEHADHERGVPRRADSPRFTPGSEPMSHKAVERTKSRKVEQLHCVEDKEDPHAQDRSRDRYGR